MPETAGAREEEARMVSLAVRGTMREDRELRAEVFSLIGVG